MKKILFVILAVLFITACSTVNEKINDKAKTDNNIEFFANDALKRFDSKQEIIDYIKENTQTSSYYGYGRAGGIMALAEEADMAVKSAAPSASDSYKGASDYSQTNIQVAGVDEPDFIKNDGEYIYLIQGSELIIVKAFPADNADIISQTMIKGYPTNMFLNGDKVIVFTNYNDNVMGFEKYDAIPRPIYKQMTKILVYDVSSKVKPKLLKDFDVKGYFVSARMIENYVYLIAQDPVYHYGPFIDTPVLRENGKIIASPDIFYFDNPDNNFNFNTVMSLNLENYETNVVSFMMGYAGTIYVSEKNIFITYQRNYPWRYMENYNKDKFNEVVIPILPADYKNRIMNIYSSDETESEKWEKISAALEEMYNSMDEDEKEDFITDVEEAMTEYEVKLEEERQKTIIHRISIDNGKIGYGAKGEVKGYMLNQFSMDEFDNNLRVATTFNAWNRGDSIQYNNVYVLDDSMKIIGKEEKIAPQERIYSARFMGNKLYLVTFKQIDPFFVIDLSEPTSPKILGELKLPGFSEYLHPYDETHIIGFGKDTGENEWGGVSTKGLKLTLFDVSDFENPRLVDQYVFGDQSSYSEALNDHKAFLFSKDKNLLVVPATIVSEDAYDKRYGYYRQTAWQGAYAFYVDEKGIELKDKIKHMQGDNYWEFQVRRSLYMDNVLYTISSAKIVMNELDSMDKLGEVKIPSIRYYDEPMPYVIDDPTSTVGPMAPSGSVGNAKGEIAVEEIVVE